MVALVVRYTRGDKAHLRFVNIGDLSPLNFAQSMNFMLAGFRFINR